MLSPYYSVYYSVMRRRPLAANHPHALDDLLASAARLFCAASASGSGSGSGSASHHRRAARRTREETGSASIVIALSLSVLALSLSVLVAAAALVERQQLASAADAAVLAAADTAIGLVTGVPCERAEQIAVRNRATMVDCRVEGFEARVTVSRLVMGVLIHSSARAAPAPHTDSM